MAQSFVTWCEVLLKNSDCQVVDDHSRVTRVIVTRCYLCNITFKAVAPKEEFADVTAHGVLEDELTAWVHADKLLQVEDQVV